MEIRVTSFWNKLSLLGTDPRFSDQLNRSLILGNRMATIAGPLVFGLAFLYTAIPAQFWVYMGGAFFCFFFLVLNRWGYINFSRFFFTFGVPLFMAVGGLYIPEPLRTSQRLALISTIIVPLVLFGISEFRPMVLGLLWTIFCFVIVDFIPFKPVSSEFIKSVSYFSKEIAVVSAMITFGIFISTWSYLQKLSLEAEEKLKVLLKESHLQKDEIENQKKQLESINRELRIRALGAQLNPHFLYNSLNSIQHFLTINDKKSSLTYLSKFGKLVRQFIEYADQGAVPLEEEIKLLEHYLELEILRFGSRFNYSIEVEEGLLLHPIHVPLLVVQVHVENAILHGLMNKESGDGQLSVKFRKENDLMICTIQDNGIGRKESERRKSKRMENRKSRGIGVSTQRLELIYKDYSADHLIKIDDLYDDSGNPVGTRVELHIPMETTPNVMK